MISSEQEYRITKASAAELEAALNDCATDIPARDPLWERMVRASIERELASRYTEMQEYETSHPEIAAEAHDEKAERVGYQLIRARILAGVRLDDLARRLGMSESALCEAEARDYADVSVDTLQHIAGAIGARIHIAPPVSVPAAG